MSDQVPDSQPYRCTRWLRRNGLGLWWVLFATLTLHSARHPGFVRDPTAVPYPWHGVVTTWLILAIETGILYAIIRPRTFNGGGRRLAAALLYAFVLCVHSVVTMVTCLAGYHYVPWLFAVGTMLGLLVLLAAGSILRAAKTIGPQAPAV